METNDPIENRGELSLTIPQDEEFDEGYDNIVSLVAADLHEQWGGESPEGLDPEELIAHQIKTELSRVKSEARLTTLADFLKEEDPGSLKEFTDALSKKIRGMFVVEGKERAVLLQKLESMTGNFDNLTVNCDRGRDDASTLYNILDEIFEENVNEDPDDYDVEDLGEELTFESRIQDETGYYDREDDDWNQLPYFEEVEAKTEGLALPCDDGEEIVREHEEAGRSIPTVLLDEAQNSITIIAPEDANTLYEAIMNRASFSDRESLNMLRQLVDILGNSKLEVVEAN